MTRKEKAISLGLSEEQIKNKCVLSVIPNEREYLWSFDCKFEGCQVCWSRECESEEWEE